MAERKPQYPQRVDISQQGAGQAAIPASTARQIGGVINTILGGALTGARVAVNPAGEVLRQAIGAPGVRRNAAEFTEGALGLAPGVVAGGTTARAPAAAKAAPKAQAQPKAASAKAKQEEQIVTPQIRALAAIDSILSQPFTLRAFQAATGALPQVAASGKPPMSARDQANLSASAAADAIYQAQLGAASGLAEGERAPVIEKATEEYYKRLAALGGAPNQYPLEQLLALQQLQQ